MTWELPDGRTFGANCLLGTMWLAVGDQQRLEFYHSDKQRLLTFCSTSREAIALFGKETMVLNAKDGGWTHWNGPRSLDEYAGEAARGVPSEGDVSRAEHEEAFPQTSTFPDVRIQRGAAFNANDDVPMPSSSSSRRSH